MMQMNRMKFTFERGTASVGHLEDAGLSPPVLGHPSIVSLSPSPWRGTFAWGLS